MNTHALSQLSDTDLYKLLNAHYATRDHDTGSKGTAHENKLVREVKRRVGSVIETATRTLPDAEAAFNEAWLTLTSPEVVTFFLHRWRTGSLASLAWGVARRNEVREAGLAGQKQRRRDPLYGNRSRSIEAMLEDGDDLAGPTLDHRTLDEVEEDERARIRSLREAFNQVSAGVLTEKQRKVILAHTNLHRDDAPAEMNTHDAVAKSLRISRAAVTQHIKAAQENAKRYPVLSIAIREICGDVEGVSSTVELMMAEA